MAVIIGLIMAAYSRGQIRNAMLQPHQQSRSIIAGALIVLAAFLLRTYYLTEVPIVGTLFGYSTGVTAPGPALSLLLAGPSLSLPSMIVIWRVKGARKAGAYISLVVIISTFVGVIYGAIMS